MSQHELTQNDQVHIDTETLINILSKMLGSAICHADYQAHELHGGTLGDVRLVKGIALTTEGIELPYKVVWKKQKKWERPGDPSSWRREYDLYLSDLGKAFSGSLSWPECYHAEINGDEIEIWMEYIDGISGKDLTIEMLEQAALELGRFQGRVTKLYTEFRKITCLGDTGFLGREFNQWHTQTFAYDFLISGQCRFPGFLKQMLKNGEIQLVESKSFEFSFLRSRGCGLPEHLKQMLIDIDGRKDEIFERITSLPIILCHRDFWIENIFFTDGVTKLIDWDTAGWGYLGEDIASLMVDEMEVERIEENYHRLIPAYLNGLSEYMDVPSAEKLCILDMILIKFGYRMMQEFMFSEPPAENCWGISALQKIYEMVNGK